MQCIVCGSDTRVTNSRPHTTTTSVWRRRSCKSCQTTFTTWENVQDDDYEFMVVASSEKVPFSLPRLMISIHSSLAHRRPATRSADEAYWLATTVAQQIKASAQNSVQRDTVAEVTHKVLTHFDDIAALTYGARHGLK